MNGVQNAAISFFPLIFASDRQPFDIVEVFRVELDVLPQRTPSGAAPTSRQRLEAGDHVEQLFVDGFLSDTAERAV